MTNYEDLITIDEACTLLEISRPTFSRIRKDHNLIEYKVGKRSRFSRKEITDKILIPKISVKAEPVNFTIEQPALSKNSENEKLKPNVLSVIDFSLEEIFKDTTIINIDSLGLVDAFCCTSLMLYIMNKTNRGIPITIESEHLVNSSYFVSLDFFSQLIPRSNNLLTINPKFNFERKEFFPKIILPISHVGFKGAERRYTDEIKKILKTQGFSDDICHYIGWSLGELADNAHTHSNSNGACFISIERLADESKSFIEINILDMGEGIHNTLKKNPKYKNLSDEQALIMAFKSKVSSWGDEYERGKGLTDILKIAFECNSFFRVESGENAYQFYCKGKLRSIKKIKPSIRINGTRFSITLIDEMFNEVTRQEVDKFIDDYLETV